MSFRNIGINDEAYARLKQFKLPGDSFSAVILRELPEPCKTAGEIESYFKEHGVPEANPKLRRAMLAGRGRRSSRK
jgi:predicted CopG family antitoxin